MYISKYIKPQASQFHSVFINDLPSLHMSHENTAHELFRINLKDFALLFLRLAQQAQQNIGEDPTPWQWFTEGGFKQFLYTLKETSSSVRPPKITETYTRANYVKFSQMIFFIQTQLPHLLQDLPQWQYLVTELHCRVLEREALAVAHPGQDVNAQLQALLCRMKQ
jgi:hypothetical protein